MRRNRRMVLMDRVIPLLAALVGLIALAGAVVVQMNTNSQSERLSQELARMRLAIDLLSQRADGLTQRTDGLEAAANDGTIDGLLALQDRMNRLEENFSSRPATGPSPLSFPAANGEASARPAEIDPSWPTTDCIPAGTRFMATPGDSIAICQTPVVVEVSAITGDNVMIEGAGVITETAFKPIAGTNCSLMVFSADAEGFAEMRVNCQ